MTSINQTAGQELIFELREKVFSQYDLLAGETPIAGLVWQKKSGTLAQADADEGSWTFKRTGSWHPQITIRATGTEADIGAFVSHWTGKGDLTFQNGVSYHFESKGFWHRTWHWYDTAGNELVQFESKQSWTKFKGLVTINSNAQVGPDLPLLVLFGWYLIVLMSHDANNAAVMTSVTAATTAATTAAISSSH